MRVVVIGTSSAGHILQSLINQSIEVALVLAPPLRAGVVRSLHHTARKNGIASESAAQVKTNDFAERLRSLDVDVLLAARSPYVIPETLLPIPRVGCFNLHTGPLPEYAGRNVISWAIFNRQSFHGVTLHWMEAGIDTGPIAYQERFPLEDSDNGITLTRKCMQHANQIVTQLVQQIGSAPEDIPRLKQDLSLRQYFDRTIPNEGRLDFRWPADRVAAFVRACDFYPFRSPWGHATTSYGDLPLQVLKAELTGNACQEPPGMISRIDENGVDVACNDETVRITQFGKDGDRIDVPAEMKRGQRLGP